MGKVIVLIVIVLTGICSAQTSLIKVYKDVNFYAVTPTQDGNFVVTGDNDASVMYAVKVNQLGDIIWEKTYELGGGGRAIVPDSDGNFVIVGIGTIVKINNLGNTIWSYTNMKTHLLSICPIDGKNFLAVGYTEYCGQLMKISSNGDTMTQKLFCGPNSYHELSSISPSTSSNFVIGGNTDYLADSNGFGQMTYSYISTIKANGDSIWTRLYTPPEAYYSAINAVLPMFTNSIISVGYSNSHMYLIKWDSQGKQLWTKTLGEGDLKCVTTTQDSCIIAAGYTNKTYSSYLIKLRQNGDTVWSGSFGRGGIFSMAKTITNDFLCFGTGFIGTIVDDKYVSKGSVFKYKIPTGSDSLNYAYSFSSDPLGMSISAGGTITWNPTTDLPSKNHIIVLIWDDFHKTDTLSFNLLVNMPLPAIEAVSPSVKSPSKVLHPRVVSASAECLSLLLPISEGKLHIYDMHGKLVGKTTIHDSKANLRSSLPTGQYIASYYDKTIYNSESFTVIR